MTITVDDLTIPSRSEFTRNAPIRGNPEWRQFNKFVNSVYARDKQIIFGHCYAGVTAGDTMRPSDVGGITQANSRADSRDLFEFQGVWDGLREDRDGEYRIILEAFGRELGLQVRFLSSGTSLDVSCGSGYDYVKNSAQLNLAPTYPEVVDFRVSTDGDEDGQEDLIAWAVSYEYLTDTTIP